MDNINLTELLRAVITLLAVVISTFVIPYIRKKANAAELEEFFGWVKIAVAAAEQLYDSAAGEDKKRYVVDYLEHKGYSVDVDDLENAIEAAVLDLHNKLYGGSGNA